MARPAQERASCRASPSAVGLHRPAPHREVMPTACCLTPAEVRARAEPVRKRCRGKGREPGGAEGGGVLTGRGLGLLGGACGGGAGLRGGCFHPGLGPPSSAGAARRGGVSGPRTDA